MNLNELRDEAYSVAREHGWHDNEQSDETLLMLVVTELAEAVQADRKGERADLDAFEKHERRIPFEENFERHVKDSLEDELADVIIRLLDFAGLKGMDVETFDVTPSGLPFPDECFYICKILSDACGELRPMAVSYIISEAMAYCASKGVEIEWFVKRKMEYNRLRPYRHGGKAY